MLMASCKDIVTLENDCKTLVFNDYKVVAIKPGTFNKYSAIESLKTLSDCDFYSCDPAAWTSFNSLTCHTFKLHLGRNLISLHGIEINRKDDVFITFLTRMSYLPIRIAKPTK